MTTLDLTTAETLKINKAIEKFLQADAIRITAIPTAKGIAVTVEDYYGEDLERSEFKDLAQEVLEELTEFVLDKFQYHVGRATVKNLDSNQIETVFNKPTKVASTAVGTKKELIASTGELRDEISELLVQSRNSLLDAIDHLYDAKNLAQRGLSESIAENIDQQVIELLDGDTTSALNSLRAIIKTLNKTTLTYEE